MNLGWVLLALAGLTSCAMAHQDDHADHPVWLPVINQDANGCALDPFQYSWRIEPLTGRDDGPYTTLDECIDIADELLADDAITRWGEPVQYRCGRGCDPDGVPYQFCGSSPWRAAYDSTCDALVDVGPSP